jgi:hypothetical protein
MNREETKMILQMLKGLYRKEFANDTPESLTLMLNIWSELLKDDNADQVANAVKAIASTDISPFSPTIGKIREVVTELYAPKRMTEQEAWNAVKKVLSYGVSDTSRAFNDLPDELKPLLDKQTIREWANEDLSKVNTVIASNFMRSYKSRSESNHKYEALPNSMKIQIESIKANMLLDNKKDEDNKYE